MAENKNLEGKLRAIQELKREKYIGTKEAWNYLDRVNALYENPIKISEEINDRIAEDGKVYYKATPERIIGLGDFYEEIIGNFFMRHDTRELSDNLLNEIAMFVKDAGSPLSKYKTLIFGKKGKLSKEFETRNPEELTNYLIPIFKNMQFPETTNRDYGIYAINYTLNKIKTDKKEEDYILSKVYSADWDCVCSRENLNNIEREIKLAIFLREIKIIDRVARMYNDQVDHRLENRREILVDFINNTTSESEGQLSYDFLSQQILERAQNRKNRLEIFKQNPHTPQVLFDNAKRMIKETEFLLTAIASEKNFINKYLRG